MRLTVDGLYRNSIRKNRHILKLSSIVLIISTVVEKVRGTNMDEIGIDVVAYFG